MSALFVSAAMLASSGAQAQFPAFFDTRDLDGANGRRIIGQIPFSATAIAATSADLNGDGLRDLITSSPASEIAAELPGTVYVIFGGSTLDELPTIYLDAVGAGNGFRIVGLNALANLGENMIGGFDWDGDGLDDVAICEPESPASGHIYAGRVHVIFGQPGIGASGSFDIASLNGSNGFVINGPPLTEALMGRTIAVGDFNDDLWPDLALGSPGNGLGPLDGAGEVFVIFGGPGVGSGGSISVTALNGANGFRIIGENAHDVAYLGLGPIGDINGDGIDDIGTGSDRVDALGRTDAGRCYVIFGSPTIGAGGLIDLRELTYPEGFVINGAEANSRAYFIRGNGDVNGDGYGDFTLGAELFGADPVYCIFGGPGVGSGGSIDLADVAWPAGAVIMGLGDTQASGIAGDVNADGYDDLAVGFAPAWLLDPNEPFDPQFNPRQGAGRVSVVYGAPELGIDGPILAGTFDTAGDLNGENGFAVWGDVTGRALGTWVFPLGDVNHDGVDDFGAKVDYSRTSENLPRVDGLYVIHGRRKFALADFDLDGDVDMADFMKFVMCYNGPLRPPAGGCPEGVRADFDGDGDVDLADYANFSQNYTGAK